MQADVIHKHARNVIPTQTLEHYTTM